MNPLRVSLLLALRTYRILVSPVKNAVLGIHGACRFYPTCSAYAEEAVQRHGVVCGVALATRRICRCHPWGGSGIDRVPETVRIIS
jgi:putative membrane protein insertion efficiency factor